MYTPVLLSLLALILPVLADQPVTTIIDVLSSSPQFSEFLNLLQRHALVPLINQSRNSTLIAPINSAFAGVDTESITKDQLLYHFVNATVFSWDLKNDQTQVYPTYLDEGRAPITMDLEDGVNGYAEFVDFDLAASPGRGVVQAVLDLLDVPSSLEESLYLEPDLSNFSELVDKGIENKIVLAPSNNALNNWLARDSNLNSTSVIRDYLKSPFGSLDRKKLLARQCSSEEFANNLPLDIELDDGNTAKIHQNFSIEFNNRIIDSRGSIRVARNGFFIVLDDVLADSAQKLLELTDEKFILGMGGHSLVKSLRLYGLHSYIDGTNTDEQVIIVPQPPENGVSVNLDPTKLVLYQLLTGHLPSSEHSQLMDSKMSLRSGKFPQRVHYNRRSSNKAQTLNWEPIGSTEYSLGNTSFYYSSELLSAPPSLSMVLGPLLTSSHSFRFLDKLDRLHLPLRESWTMLIPTRDAWEKNMLLIYYIDKNHTALESVFNSLVLKQPFYTDSKPSNVTQFDNSAIELSNSVSDTLKLTNSEISEEISIDVSDVLFDNGVVHIVSSVPIPQSLEVTSTDLIKASKRSYFVDLLRAANMENVLDPHANYTVLVPPTEDLKRANYTTETDPKRLVEMLKLHLLPNNPMKMVLQGDTVDTLANEKLSVQVIDEQGTLFGLTPVSAKQGQRVLLYEYGYSNGYVAGGSTVVLLDRHISPIWILPEKKGLHSTTFVVIGILSGILICSGCFFAIVYRFAGSKPGEFDLEQSALRQPEPTFEHERYTDEANHSAPIAAPGRSEGHSPRRELQGN